jgi:hypothetical protein
MLHNLCSQLAHGKKDCNCEQVEVSQPVENGLANYLPKTNCECRIDVGEREPLSRTEVTLVRKFASVYHINSQKASALRLIGDEPVNPLQ